MKKIKMLLAIALGGLALSGCFEGIGTAMSMYRVTVVLGNHYTQAEKLYFEIDASKADACGYTKGDKIGDYTGGAGYYSGVILAQEYIEFPLCQSVLYGVPVGYADEFEKIDVRVTIRTEDGSSIEQSISGGTRKSTELTKEMSFGEDEGFRTLRIYDDYYKGDFR